MHSTSQPDRRFGIRLFVIVSVAIAMLFFAEFAPAAKDTDVPTTWWPDPATGLMWTGSIHGQGMSLRNLTGGITYDQAAQYCSSLRLGGYSDWRLPTLEEVQGASQVMRLLETIPVQRELDFWHQRVLTEPGGVAALFDRLIQPIPPDLPPEDIGHNGQKLKSFLAYYPKGTKSVWRLGDWVWTSTPPAGSDPTDADSAVTFHFGVPIDGNDGPAAAVIFLQKSKAEPQAECVRAMEPELAQIAAEAGPVPPVSDVETLRKYIPFNKARLAYQAGNYQETIADAQETLQGLPNWRRAYWAMGIAYARLGQWDEAIANLKKANGPKIGWSGDAIIVASLNWAEDSRKALKSGKPVTEKMPEWFPYPTDF